MTVIDNRTAHLNLTLPNQANLLSDDVGRLISALNGIDSKFVAIDLLLASTDINYDTVQEVVDRLKNTDVAGTSLALSIALG